MTGSRLLRQRGHHRRGGQTQRTARRLGRFASDRRAGERRLQVGEHLAGTGVTLVGVLGHGPPDDRRAAFGDGRVDLPRVGDRVVAVREEDLGRAGGVGVGASASQQGVVGRPQGVEVAPGIDRLPLALLGAHVGRRAEDLAGGGEGLFEPVGELGQTEIGQLDRPLVRHQDVGGLDVAVDHAGVVRGDQPSADLGHQPRRQGPLDRATILQQIRPTGRPATFQDEIIRRSVAADLMNPDDVRVAQAGRGARLLKEALQGVLVLGQALRQQLDRHGTAKQVVLGRIHDPHPPFAEDAGDAVVPQEGPQPPVGLARCLNGGLVGLGLFKGGRIFVIRRFLPRISRRGHGFPFW